MVKEFICNLFDVCYTKLSEAWTKIWKDMDENPVCLIVTLLSIAFLVWIIASTIDVDMHNMPYHKNYGQYASWNLWEIIVKWHNATH